MEVTLAKTAGFCFGVKRAVDKVYELADKEDKVYTPLLKAFMEDFNALQESNNVTSKLVEYLIGSNGRDYYKLIHHNNHTTVMPFNLYGMHQAESK